MKRLLLAFAVVLGLVPAGLATEPASLNSLRAVHSLSNAEADRALPASFEATVTYYKTSDTDLFVQDGDTAIYVAYKAGANLRVGDRVLVTGRTQGSFRPIVNADSVEVKQHGKLPAPVPATFAELVSSRLDCRRVKVQALVRSIDLVGSAQPPGMYVNLAMDGGDIDAAINTTDPAILTKLLDTEVELTGIATAKFDQRNQLTGARIDVQSLDDLKILKMAPKATSRLPVTPYESIFGSYRSHDQSQRVRVQGTITYFQPGTTLVIQSGNQSLWVSTRSHQPVRIGDIADVTGFPAIRNSYLTLLDAEVSDTGIQAPVQPLAVSWRELGFGGNAFRLISTEARVVRQVRRAAVDEYVLEVEGQVFSAIYRLPPSTDTVIVPPMKAIPVGSRIRVVGIGMFYTSDPFNGPVASDILLRSPDDISVIAPPPLLNVRNLGILASALLLLVFVAIARAWMIERRMRKQAALFAEHEKKRSRILEDINSSRPLAEILEHITELMSLRLDGAPCWCQIAGGALLGNRPEGLEGRRVVSVEIPARSGPPLGTAYAAFDQLTKPGPDESEKMALVVRLATLAIETQRLHSDLIRRSEFDMLTDIPNRFSLERYMDVSISRAREDASIFGLVYIDLDEFKQINDRFGHGVGDLYLQEVSRRMKNQLRSADMLARIGGDEFAALLPMIHSRAEVEEIASRLQLCFREPMNFGGELLSGTASIGIALYPEDGTTRDSLLNASDTAMYRSKYARREDDPALEAPSGRA